MRIVLTYDIDDASLETRSDEPMYLRVNEALDKLAHEITHMPADTRKWRVPLTSVGRLRIKAEASWS